MFFEVLVEGTSDVPTVREILSRRFQFKEDDHFRIYPHQGKGRIPTNPNRKPEIAKRGLLDQLPAKLRGYASRPADYIIVVLVDADNDDCIDLKTRLTKLYQDTNPRPKNVLFRIAIKEIESWFLADREAIKKAYPKARLGKIPKGNLEKVVDAWERLAGVLGIDVKTCGGQEKLNWAEAISPHLELDNPNAQSLRAFIDGIEKHRNRISKL